MSKLPDGMELYGHFTVIQPEVFFRLGGVSISNQYVYVKPQVFFVKSQVFLRQKYSFDVFGWFISFTSKHIYLDIKAHLNSFTHQLIYIYLDPQFVSSDATKSFWSRISNPLTSISTERWTIRDTNVGEFPRSQDVYIDSSWFIDFHKLMKI